MQAGYIHLAVFAELLGYRLGSSEMRSLRGTLPGFDSGPATYCLCRYKQLFHVAKGSSPHLSNENNNTHRIGLLPAPIHLKHPVQHPPPL